MDGAVIEGSQCIGQDWIMYRAPRLTVCKVRPGMMV